MRAGRAAGIAALALAAVVAAGCGDDDQTVTAGSPADEAPEGGIVDDAPADDADPSGLRLELGFEEPLRAGQGVGWELSVSNVGADETVVTFGSGQSGEVVLTDGDGEEAYRWSTDQMFTQAIREEPLAAGETARYELDEPALDVEPGSYELTATLTGDPAPEPLTRTVEVG